MEQHAHEQLTPMSHLYSAFSIYKAFSHDSVDSKSNSINGSSASIYRSENGCLERLSDKVQIFLFPLKYSFHHSTLVFKQNEATTV